MNKMCVCEGRTQCIPKPKNMAIIPNTKIKKIEYTHTIILNIEKVKNTYPKKNEKEKI